MVIHLILLAINEINPVLQGSVHIYSDCLGALDKVSRFSRPQVGLKRPLKPGTLGRPEEHSGQLQRPLI
jgi:hypothetical protein